MTKKSELYLHIGTHKTGSTALQKFLLDKSSTLSDSGIAFYEGMIEKENHLELHVSAMKLGRQSFSKDKYRLQGTADFQDHVRQRVGVFQKKNQGKDLIFSAEGLYLLRSDCEFDVLKSILSADRYNITVVLALRNAHDFLQSMRAQISKVPRRTPSSDPSSHLYVEPDSWLADYEQVKALWRSNFGDENLRVVDYDHSVATANGNVLPAMLTALNIPKSLQQGCEGYYHNKQTNWTALKQRIYSLVKGQ